MIAVAPTRWAEFLHWAERIYAYPEALDADETNYKLEVARSTGAARAAFARGEGWLDLLKRAFRHPKNNLTHWRAHQHFLSWCDQSQTRAREALTRIWDESKSPATAVVGFDSLFPKSALSGAGGRLSIAAFLLFGRDPHSFVELRLDSRDLCLAQGIMPSTKWVANPAECWYRLPFELRGDEQFLPPETKEGLERLRDEEERRLMYVGVTRARKRLVLSRAWYYGDNKTAKGPSPFWEEALPFVSPRECESPEENPHPLGVEVTPVVDRVIVPRERNAARPGRRNPTPDLSRRGR